MVTFSSEMQADLERRGVSLRLAFGTYQIGSEPLFEPPVAVASELNFHFELSIGAFSHLNGGCIQNAQIGRYCSFARDVQIGHGFHPTDWLSVSPMQYGANYRNFAALAHRLGAASAEDSPVPFTYQAPTKIGNDVWLGNHVFVTDGVTIGDGAIIGAGAIVTKDVEPYAIMTGNPARPLRQRFSDSLVERMLRLRWWRFALADIGKVDYSDPSGVLDVLEALIEDGTIEEYRPEPVRLIGG